MRFFLFLLSIIILRYDANASIPPPSNDEPCNAITLPVNNSCIFATFTTTEATASGFPDPGCADYAGGDVWFKVTVPPSGLLNIETDNIDFSDGGMAIYKGTCISLILIECDDDDGSGHMPLINNTALTPGDTIWIRVWEKGNNDMGLFNICVSTIQTPINDDPCNAILINVNTSCTPVTVDNTNATSSNISNPGCANYLGGDIWYKAVVPVNGYLNFNTSSGDITNAGMALYTGACNALNLFACNDDDGIGAMPEMSFLNLIPGDTIWIRLWEKGNDNFGTFNFCVNNEVILTPPSCSINDTAGNTCAQATQICNLDGYCGNTSSSYTADYWPELGDGSNSNAGAFGQCLGGATIQNNSFLKFVAADTIVKFNVWVTSTTDGIGIQMMFFEANNCQGPVICHGGYDNLFPGPPHLITANNLVVGNTYYLMIDGVRGDVCDYVIGALSGLSSLVVTTSNANVCMGNSVSVNATGIVGTGTNFNWTWIDSTGNTRNQTGAAIIDTPRRNTTYTVTASGVGVCPQTKSITVNVSPYPTVNLLTANQNICRGENAFFVVQGTASSTLNYNINNGANNSLLLTGENDTITITNPAISQTLNIISVDLNSCSNTPIANSSTITVVNSTATISSNNSPICINSDANFSLTGTINSTITYNINGGANTTTTLNGNTGTVTIPNANTNQTLNLISVSNQGCVQNINSSSTVIVNNRITPTFNQWGPYCINANIPQIILPTTSNNGISGTWNPATISTSNTGNIQYTFTPLSDQNCANSYNATIVVNPNPTNIDAGSNMTINSGGSAQLQGAGIGTSFLWSPATGLSNTGVVNPIANPTTTTTYTLTVQNDFGCFSSDSVTVFVVNDCVEPMKIFTPNNDGHYDKWIIYTGLCIKTVEASVYNRYGSQVFYAKDYKNDWSGTYNGKALPDATYYFVLNITDQNNRRFTRKGSVTIMR